MRIQITAAKGGTYVVELEQDMIDEEVQVWIYENLKEWSVEGWRREPRMCSQHGGEWGDDETCVDCTDEWGNPRP